jgi:MFS family permease
VSIAAPRRAAAWAPLRHREFRLVWLTFLGVQLANWGETVGAVAVISDRSDSAALLALVQTASTVPAVALALPAGVAADLVDRRTLLIGLVLSMAASMALLAGTVAAGAATPAVVLMLTVVLGCAIAVAVPAFASLIPDLVPRADLAAAVTLNGISINLARALGPAVAGLILAFTTASALFVALGVTLAALAMLLLAIPERVRRPAGREAQWWAAMRSGVVWARGSAALRAVLVRGFFYVVPASALWAMLPVVAVQRLGLAPAAFGGVLAALGAGAVLGAQLLPWLRARLGLGRLMTVGSACVAVNLVVLGLIDNVPVAVLSIVLSGASWITVLSSLNTSAQLAAPDWVRGRALSINQCVFATGMAGGSAAWGFLADATSLRAALLAAAALLVASLATARRWSLATLP